MERKASAMQSDWGAVFACTHCSRVAGRSQPKYADIKMRRVRTGQILARPEASGADTSGPQCARATVNAHTPAAPASRSA